MTFQKKSFLIFSFFISFIIGLSIQAEVEDFQSRETLNSLDMFAARGSDNALPGSYMVYYSQFDPRYANKMIGGYFFGETGCIPTSIAMVFESYGVSGDPYDWGVRLYHVGEFNTVGGGATRKAIRVAADMAGLTAIPLMTKEAVDTFLKNAVPIIYCGGSQISNSIGYGHAVVLYGLSDGQTFLTDPSRNAMTGWHSTAFLWDNRIADRSPSFFGITGPSLPQTPVRILVVHRVYNPNGDRHLFTTNSHERDDLVRLGWHDEGVAFQALTEGIPIYRVYDKNSGEHLYTANSLERDDLVRRDWQDEGSAYYVSDLGFAEGKGTPVYRMYNPRNGEHMYTTNYNEIVKATAELGWKYEGIAWCN